MAEWVKEQINESGTLMEKLEATPPGRVRKMIEKEKRKEIRKGRFRK